MKIKRLAVVLFCSAMVGCGVSGTSATVGPSGGKLSLGSALTLEIPQGALEGSTTVAIVEVSQRANEREFQLEPKDLKLKSPARASIEASEGAEVWVREGEVEHRAEARRVGGRLEVEIHRLARLRVRGHDDRPGDDRGGAGASGGGDDSGAGGSGAGGSGGGEDSGAGGSGAGGSGGGDDSGAGGSGAGGAGAGTAGTSCVDDDTCACGSECVSGQCTPVVVCATNADCSGGASCRAASRHGQLCGVMACHP